MAQKKFFPLAKIVCLIRLMAGKSFYLIKIQIAPEKYRYIETRGGAKISLYRDFYVVKNRSPWEISLYRDLSLYRDSLYRDSTVI